MLPYPHPKPSVWAALRRKMMMSCLGLGIFRSRRFGSARFCVIKKVFLFFTNSWSPLASAIIVLYRDCETGELLSENYLVHIEKRMTDPKSLPFHWLIKFDFLLLCLHNTFITDLSFWFASFFVLLLRTRIRCSRINQLYSVSAWTLFDDKGRLVIKNELTELS